MFVLCCVCCTIKDKRQSQDNPDKETSTKREQENKKIPVEAVFSAPVQTGPVAHQTCCTVGTGSFSWGKAAGAGR